jgi:hypothetical protein
MSSLVIKSLFIRRYHRRRVDRARKNHRFRFGHEMLEDRITPTTVTGLSPTFGPAFGTTPVTITGTGFTGVTAVDFGTTSVGFTPVNTTTITTVSPAGTGVVNVTVTAASGTSPITPADEFTYGPTVTGLSPTSGPAAGGTPVTIIGTGFTGATSVNFGTAQVTNITVVSANSVTAVSPPGSGVVDVTVTTPAGTSPPSPADQFTYPNVPTVTLISPNSGTAAGGTTVTITGTNFTSPATVDFGTIPATNVTVLSPTQVTAVSPAGSGVVDVTVTASGSMSATSPADQFTYGPTITSVSPRSGPLAGNTPVTITGTNLSNVTAIAFGTTQVTSSFFDTGTQIFVNSPAGMSPGTVDVTVTNPVGTSPTSPADQFTYSAPAAPAPTVSSISPTAGPPTGGTTVTITGTNFTMTSTVDFGTIPATNVQFVTSNELTAVSPAGSGVVDVLVTTSGGTSAPSPADMFSYKPTVTSVSPRSGPVTGGTEVAITGTNLSDVTAVDFGSTPAAAFSSQSDTLLLAISPAAASAGVVDVTVTTGGGTSATSTADQFLFGAAVGAVAPRVTSISPAFGSPGGGTLVTITGIGYDQTNPALVFFGTLAATSVTVINTTTIAATSPAGTGTVDVTVTTFGGTSAITPADTFTYTVDGPLVTSVQRFGFHAQPTFLVIDFNSALDRVPATKVSNYLLTGPNGRRIKVISAIYNSATHAVTLRPAQQLNLHKTYILTINGTAPSGLTNSDGLLLDGARTGQPGSNFVTSITNSNLAGSDSQRPIAAVVQVRAKRLFALVKLSTHRHAK